MNPTYEAPVVSETENTNEIISPEPNGAFEELVVKCRNNDVDFTIHNSSWSHALFLFYNLLEVAIEKHEPVYLISGSLDSKFFGDPGLLARFEKCQSENIPVDILVVNNPEMDVSDHPLGNLISTNDHFSITVSPKPVQVPHMLAIGGDGRRYRFEVDHNQTKAEANFNDSYTGSMLVEFFRHVKSVCVGDLQAQAAA